MKKYLLGSTAIAFAIVFSAFTRSETKHTNNTKTDTMYFWYTDGTNLGGYIGDFTTHSSAKSASTCNDLGSTVCARGYTQAQLVNQTIGNPPAAVGTYTDQIVKNN